MEHPPRPARAYCRCTPLALAFLLFAPFLLAQAPPEPQTVLILYDGPSGESDYQSKGYIHALFVENLLGHFSLPSDIEPLAEYQPGQLQRHRAAFFIGVTANTVFPAGFLQDVRAYQGPFTWLGQHIEQLLALKDAPRQYGFTYQQYLRNAGAFQVVYKDTPLPRIEQDLNFVTVQSKAVEVVATALTKDGASHPYALHRGSFWYFADSPFAYVEEGNHYLAFCDLLHDILEIEHPADQRALARIEDVSVDQDPEDLQRVSDLLAAQKVPFQIALIPIFRDPAKELEVRLSDRKSFGDVVHYMISKGGTPVMHGVTHQYRAASGDDYEFWDDTGDHAVVGDSTEFVIRRLQLGLSECFNAGIYPVAFEVPHYGASRTDYLAMMRVFSLFYDRTMSTRSLNSLQYFPYPVTDHWGRFVIPEDLGYVPIENPQTKEVLRAARSLKVVRDGVASFYFHPFLNPKLLDEIVRGIRGLGYRFVSIRDFSSEVNFQGRYAVRTASGNVHLSPQQEYWRMRLFAADGTLVQSVVSETRQNAPVDVAVQVPHGGWAALDCIKERPVERAEPSLLAKAQQWWTQLVSAERAPAGHSFLSGRKVWLFWLDKAPLADQRNQQSYRSMLDTFGYDVRLVKPAEFTRAPADTETILVVPQAAGLRLSAPQKDMLLRFLSAGGHVLADGHQDWLEKLGLHWQPERQLTIEAVSDELYPEMYLQWRPAEKVERFTVPDGVRELMADTESDQLLAFSGEYGSGQYIHLAVPFDPHTADGASHYPYLPRYMTETFGATTSLRSPRIEAYFDPSDRTAADYNRLAVQWRTSGIRTIYAAAWVFYPRWAFNYGEFIHACHRNGIAVYAWFMFPMITPKAWEDHPEWREKTATGADGRIGWRDLMNFQNPACFRAAMDWMKKQLESQDWDGVNIAELNFDADFKDYLDPTTINPSKFAPMNADVRAEFRKKAGFDPVQLFQPASPYYYKTNHGAIDKFLRYREDIVVDWHRRVLTELEPFRRAKGFEVIVTMQDSLHSRLVRPSLGVDSKRIVGLMKDFNFTLQVEDPAEFWMRPPERYRRFAQTYRKLVKDPRRLMFDINVMKDRDITSTTLASKTPTGVELARTVVEAASATGRVAIYSEHSVPAQDWLFLRMVLTRGSEVSSGTREWKVTGTTPVLLTPAEDRDYYLDGRLWPAVSTDGLLAPPGRHWVSTVRPWHHFLDPGALPTRLLGLSADLLDARVMPTGLIFRYASPGRTVAVLNQKPRQVVVDGRSLQVPFEPSGPNWTVLLPPGEHWVALTTNTRAGVAVNLFGWASASAINAFGTLATVFMVLIYFEVRVRRFVRRRA